MTRSHTGGRSALHRVRTAVLVMVGAAAAGPLTAQQLLDYTPNTRTAWTMARWQPAMVLSHRFELISGGDELINVPLVTFGTAVRERIAVGIDFTSNSEVSASSVGGNEAQWWFALRGPSGARGALNGTLAYNTAAGSVDGAVTARARTGMVSLIAEARGFSDAFGTGSSGFAGAGGAVLHLTPYLSVAADVGQAFEPSGLGTVWSGGFTVAIPGTRHQFSFHGTNGGAATLQGASREKVFGTEPARYGFTFIAPLGTGWQWAQVFRRARPSGAAASADTAAAATVDIKNLAYATDTVRIRVGQTVRWVNGDPIAHTVTAEDKGWASGMIDPAKDFSRRFMVAGTFPYHCEPHPHMKGVVIVAR